MSGSDPDVQRAAPAGDGAGTAPPPSDDCGARPDPARTDAIGVFLAFLKLGLTSFGGPVAHIGYFREEFVVRRRWVDDTRFADLLALCQFLPGPASSQLGIALGLGRAGWRGAWAAWLGFTLPSALLMIGFAYGLRWGMTAGVTAALHGLKLAAVAVVAHAVWSMGRTLCRGWARAGIALVAATLMLGAAALPGQSAHPASGAMVSAAWLQLIVIALGAAAGLVLLREPRAASSSSDASDSPTGSIARSTARGAAWLLLAIALLIALPTAAHLSGSDTLRALAVFYEAGALVFGGGHVVLPLLEAGVVDPGWVSADAFLAGYGAAQAVPGPLFTFAAYLGAVAHVGPGGWLGGLLMLGAVFLPGALLVAGAWPFWAALQRSARVRRALSGINAAVVGLLGAALVDPVLSSSIHSPVDALIAIGALALLLSRRAPPIAVVALCAIAAWMARSAPV